MEDENNLTGVPSPVWPPAPYPPDDRYGRVSISPPDPVIGGALGTWTLVYVAGKYGIDDGGGFRVMIPNNCDLGTPQFIDPRGVDFCRVACSTPPPCYVEAHYSADLGVRPLKRGLQLHVRDAAVRPGDTIVIAFGERSGGSPGTRAQTFAGRLRFHCLLDAHGTGVYKPIGPPPTLEVRAGAPDHLRVHAPSDVVVGEPFDLTVVVRDQWGNVVAHRRERTQLDTIGVHMLPVQDEASRLHGESNPVRCHATGSVPAQRIFWGDLHAQTEETGGTGTLDEYYTHARDCAAIDFIGHQANDFQLSQAAWERITAKTRAYDANHAFITFAGYEWSGNTPAGGDHNVHFRGDDRQSWTLHRSSHWQVPDDTDETQDRFPVSELYHEFHGRDDVMLIPHVGGRYANLSEYFDETLMPLVEIASCWGVFEWFAEDAFRRGKRFGFSAGSDDHTSRPGMSFAAPSQFGIGGGLTAVLANERSRDAIWAALRARRTYATTGARMLLDVVANGRYPMGAAFDAAAGVELAVSVYGTAPLWRVEVLRWPDVIYRHDLPPPVLSPGRHRLRIGWNGARIRGRRRLTQWDGALILDRGRILHATGWGFDRPDHGIIETGERIVRWRSSTAGDWDGVVVELETSDDCPIRIETAPVVHTFRPRDVANGAMTIDGGGVGQTICVERDPGPDQPRATAFAVRDEQPPAGCQPYFVRVTQQDGHIAWSSPIFATIH